MVDLMRSGEYFLAPGLPLLVILNNICYFCTWHWLRVQALLLHLCSHTQIVFLYAEYYSFFSPFYPVLASA